MQIFCMLCLYLMEQWFWILRLDCIFPSVFEFHCCLRPEYMMRNASVTSNVETQLTLIHVCITSLSLILLSSRITVRYTTTRFLLVKYSFKFLVFFMKSNTWNVKISRLHLDISYCREYVLFKRVGVSFKNTSLSLRVLALESWTWLYCKALS